MSLHGCICSEVPYFLKHLCNQHFTFDLISLKQKAAYLSNESATMLHQLSLAFAKQNFCSYMYLDQKEC